MKRRLSGPLVLALLIAALLACGPFGATANPPTETSPAPTSEQPGPTTAATDAGPTKPTETAFDAADLVFVGGDVLTLDGFDSIAEAAAIRDGKIAAVGSRDEIDAYVGPETAVVDLGGRTLMPGIVDPHTHLFNDAGQLNTDLRGAQELALSNGITTLGDMYAQPDFVDEMRALERAGDLVVRTSLYLTYTDNCGQPTGDWWRSIPPTRVAGERLRIGGVKAFADGGTCGKLAASQDIVPAYGPGDLFFSQEEMNAIFQDASESGYQLAVHAQGDRAVRQALTALGTVTVDGQNPLRHRIEHNAIVTPDLYPLYTEYDAVATLFGFRPACDLSPDFTDFFRQYGENWRALLDANPDGHFAWHGDDPWVIPLSPLKDLASLVTREQVTDDGRVCLPPDWLAATAISAQEALHLMTTGGAYALFREDEVGTIERGKYADLLILNMNPATIDPHELWDLMLEATLVDGKAVYCAAPLAPLCDRAGVLLGDS